MPTAITNQDICQLMVKTRLANAEDARAFYQRWLERAGDPNDPGSFRRFLVDEGMVTDYQAGLLFQGRTEGYFIGRYRILERIGQGRMARVYRAASPDGQVAAIKVLPPSKAQNTKVLARFQREARLMTQLDHPNVVRCYECGEWEGLNYIAMEYLSGETLDSILKRRGRLGVGESVRLVHQALMGLQHLHERGIVHRDLKPANLMLVPRPDPSASTMASNVKVLDIGLGRQRLDETQQDSQETQLTTEGVLLGTPDYWAPEQARDAHAVDIRADIYGLGCVLYHCLTGQPPFPDSEMLTQIIRHVSEPLRPAHELNPEVPDGLQQVLNYMMAKEPAHRYPTPERAARALEMFLPQVVETAQASPEEKMPEKQPEPRPKPAGTEIPVGKLVGGKTEKPPAARPKARPDASPPAPAVATPAAPVAPPAGDFDVDLVAIPFPPAQLPRKPRDQRSLFDLDRRDFIMMSAGVGGSVAAILFGLLMAKTFQRKSSDEKPKSGE